MTVVAQGRPGDLAGPQVVDTVGGVNGDGVDLVPMAGGTGGSPVGRNDALNGRAIGVQAALGGVASGVMAQGTVVLMLDQDVDPQGKAIAVIVMAAGAAGLHVLRLLRHPLRHGVDMGVIGEIGRAMAIRALGLYPQGMDRGITPAAGDQGPVAVDIGMTVTAGREMGIRAANQVAAVATATVQGGQGIIRGHQEGVVCRLMAVLEVGNMGGVAIGAAGELADGMRRRCPVAIGTGPQAAIRCRIRVTVGTVPMVDSGNDPCLMTADTRVNAGQGVMGFVFMTTRKIGRVGGVAINTGTALPVVDGLVVDVIAHGRTADSGVVMQGPATTDRHMADTAIAVDDGDILGVVRLALLIMTAGTLGRAGNLARLMVVNAVHGVGMGNGIDLVTMAGGASRRPTGGDDCLDGGGDGVETTHRGIPVSVMTKGAVALVFYQDGGPAA